jgi:hypothetical protein
MVKDQYRLTVATRFDLAMVIPCGLPGGSVDGRERRRGRKVDDPTAMGIPREQSCRIPLDVDS